MKKKMEPAGYMIEYLPHKSKKWITWTFWLGPKWTKSTVVKVLKEQTMFDGSTQFRLVKLFKMPLEEGK